MENILQTLLHDFVTHYPAPNKPAQLDLTVGTHDPCRDTSKFRLSDAGKCRLMRYWKRQGKPAAQTMEPDVLLQMQTGNLLHAYLECAVQWTGHLVEAERPLEDDHRLGHFDMIINPPDVGPDDAEYRILYDIKTISSKKAFFMDKNSNQADPQHIMQLISYALLYPDPLDELRLAYVVRDTLEIREIEVERIPSETTVIADWQLLIDAWVAQQAPAANPNKWECRYCQYVTNCPQQRG